MLFEFIVIYIFLINLLSVAMIVKVLLYLILYVHKFIEADLFGLMIAVATPKQIRELMKVDGLTNDEVKSHLQVQSLPFSFPFFLSKPNIQAYPTTIT